VTSVTGLSRSNVSSSWEEVTANERLALHMFTDFVGLYIRENRALMRLAAV